MKFNERNKYIYWIIILFFALFIDFGANFLIDATRFIELSIIVLCWLVIFLMFVWYNSKNNLIFWVKFHFDKYFARFILCFCIIYIFLLFARNGLFNIFLVSAWSNIKLNVVKEYYFYLFNVKDIRLFYMQIMYYLLESAIVTCLIALFQEFGEKFRHKNLPWGAIGISLTWGLLHILTQGVFDGIFIIFIAFILGVAYQFCNKSTLFLYLLLLNVFFL
jgi:hypothetical protein